jgi:hypothetical protein
MLHRQDRLAKAFRARPFARLTLLDLTPRGQPGVFAGFSTRVEEIDAGSAEASEESATVLQAQFGDSLPPCPKRGGRG